MDDREGLRSEEETETADPSLPGSIHSCSFCYVQELDPGLTRKPTAGDLSSGTVIKYRGSRVLDGASNGCAFFKDVFAPLEAILSTYAYQQGSDSPRFRPENWVYELFFSNHTGYLETAMGTWECAKGELPGDTQQPKQNYSDYIVLAYEGTDAKEDTLTRKEDQLIRLTIRQTIQQQRASRFGHFYTILEGNDQLRGQSNAWRSARLHTKVANYQALHSSPRDC